MSGFRASFTLGLALSAAALHAGMWMVFLNTGPGRTSDQAKMAKMQAEHIANLKRLGDAGLGMFAGPLGDNGFIRGVVMVKAKDRVDLMNHFKTDPFVTEEFLKVDAYPMDVKLSLFHAPPKRKEPVLEESTMAIIYRDRWLTKDMPRLDVLPSVEEWWKRGEVTLWGRIRESDSMVGVIYFASTDRAQVEGMLRNDPWVQDGKVRFEIHPQWGIQGILKPKPLAK